MGVKKDTFCVMLSKETYQLSRETCQLSNESYHNYQKTHISRVAFKRVKRDLLTIKRDLTQLSKKTRQKRHVSRVAFEG